MIAMHSPDVFSVSDRTLLQALTSRDRRPNFLVACSGVLADAVVQRLVEFCTPPFHFCALPGPFRLPSASGGGTLFISDPAGMSRQQQIALFDWTATSRGTQIVSVTSAHMNQLVENGDFLEGLFYRLNIVRLEASVRPLWH